jgi:hypothetical protein
MEQMEKQVGDIGGYSGVSDLAIFPGKFRLHFFQMGDATNIQDMLISFLICTSSIVTKHFVVIIPCKLMKLDTITFRAINQAPKHYPCVQILWLTNF